MNATIETNNIHFKLFSFFFADDCAERPCALNANCTDLVNDYQCACPTGFIGKRCQIKEDLCAASSGTCAHGICVDRLFEHYCLCEPGWTGALCDVNMDDCGTMPCLNGATCRDDVNAYVCQCAPGFYGSFRSFISLTSILLL